MNLRYTSRAREDLELAFAWYERQQHGLGLEFLSCIESVIESIRDNSKKFRIYYSHFRGRIVKHFPFSIFYSIEENEIVIHAVFDNRQDPKKRP